MKEYFLDTNIFLRFLVDSESKQKEESVRLFTLLESGKIKGLICSVVLLEIYFTLKSFYRFLPGKCATILAGILSIKNLKKNDNFNYQLALDLFIKKKVKFADCLISSLDFFKKGGEIISYDQDFDKLGTKRIEPSEVEEF